VQVLQPYIDSLAAPLLVIAALDRENNCRRAAAAAFQEIVGRHVRSAQLDVVLHEHALTLVVVAHE